MQHRIGPGLSTYLDTVRLAAALVVMLAHAKVSGLIALEAGLLALAPAAVIVFFVLSGFIIESTTIAEAGARRYVIHRAARIYSVALPAIALSVTLSAGSAVLSGQAGSYYEEWGQWWRLPVVLTFQGEDWFAAVEVPWDGPFWSLNYEVFYYVLYGVLTFLRGRARALTAVAVCLIGGPKILLLLPCWWLGVVLARKPELRFPSRRTAWLAFVLAPAVLLAFSAASVPGRVFYYAKMGAPWLGSLGHSQMLLTDYMIAVLTATSFVAARQLEFGPRSILVRVGPALRWAAGYTFSIYLLHRPFQHLAAQYLDRLPDGARGAALVQGAILVAIVAIGSVTERRTGSWRRAIGRVIDAPWGVPLVARTGGGGAAP